MVVADLNKKQGLETIQEVNINGTCNDNIFILTDVTKISSVLSLYDQIEAHYGRPANILVNSAQVFQRFYPFADFNQSTFDHAWTGCLDANLKGTFLMATVRLRILDSLLYKITIFRKG